MKTLPKVIEYPIKFEPILKSKIWGGGKLSDLLGKKNISNDLGESWEISDVEGDMSVVSNGDLKGLSIRQLMDTYKESFMGVKNYRDFPKQFPLLIKYIDASKDLSIQVHPDDKLAKERHNCYGKSEMWYVMQAEKDANLIVGFNQNVDKDIYLDNLNNKTLENILNFDKVSKGDTYYIPSGLVHAIGPGVLLAEIQQVSDVTYRIYDWDRLDSNGNARELHTDLAIDAINFDYKEKYNTIYGSEDNKSNKLIHNEFFKTNLLILNQNKDIDYSDLDSFVIYICVKGEINIELENSNSIDLKTGETSIIPASVSKLTIKTLSDSVEILEVYI
ncbi:MAG: class I mannose-6-phosphate isomerase [Flavobacteriaceae bacterium]|nr:class I mannose-6-phosphate isomerase [Flavobacteriaceae bacterium]